MEWHSTQHTMPTLHHERNDALRMVHVGTCAQNPLPFKAHMGWSKLGRWCQHMWRFEVLTKKTHFTHMWVGLTCTPILNKLVGPIYDIIPIACLGRFLGNNSIILGHDVSPCAKKTPSFSKSTSIRTSLDSNCTSLDVAKMQVALQLWYWISMFFALHIVILIFAWFLVALVGTIQSSTKGMTMFFVDLQVHFYAQRF